jgi:SNF2 family DNA or RNA helicase
MQSSIDIKKMNSNEWVKLFYDKYGGDHHYNNPITKDTSIEDLEDGSFHVYSGKEATSYYNTHFKSNNFHIPEDVVDSNLYNLYIYTKTVNGMDTIYTIVSVNTKRLEIVIRKKITIKNIEFLKKLCRYHISYTNSNRLAASMFQSSTGDKINKADANNKFMTEKIMNAVDYTFHEKVSPQKDVTIKLFDYQRCSINWMLEKEKNNTKIFYNMYEEVVLGNVFYDMYNQEFKLGDDRKSLMFTGGCLIDEVGLGKTIQILTLSILNPAKSTSYTNKNDQQHLYSRATLIICPNQLCGQWEREIQDKISKEFDPQIVKILTKRDYKKYTYQDLLDADFVIVSYTFLDNKAFTLPWSEQVSPIKSFSRQNWKVHDIQSISELFVKLGKELVKEPFAALMKNNPLFQLIHWNRIVVDEFHEIHADTRYRYIQNIIPFIKADHKWCISATPFVKRNSLYEAVNFLTDYTNTDGENILTDSKFVDYLSTNCFRRNTKASIKKEHTLPPIKEEIMWLKFSATERMMYNAFLANQNNDKFSVYLRQLCCHPQLADETKFALSNCKTLKEIEVMMLSHYKNEVKIATIKVDKIKLRIKKVNKKIKKIERKQKKIQLKKMGIEMDSNSESDSDSDSDSNNDNHTKNVILAKNSNNVDNAIIGLDSEEIDELFEGIGDMKSATMDNLKESIDKLEERFNIANKALNGKTTTFNFFNNVIERLRKTTSKETTNASKYAEQTTKSLLEMLEESDSDSDDENDEEMCGICLDEIPEDDVGVTKCGHIFCYECLKMSVSKFHNCPYCKEKLADNEIFILSFVMKKKSKLSNEDKKKDALINEVGTKLANLIDFLRKSDDHVIIFSQWDDLLRRIGRILAENDIKNVFCKGNCYQRDKAIREFNKDDSIKVIMLSSKQSASGTNLTKANVVIFVDPIYGNYKYRKGQEKQAIGRAHRLGQTKDIKVLRFIIKNSVEEEIYWMNVEDDKKNKILNKEVNDKTHNQNSLKTISSKV